MNEIDKLLNDYFEGLTSIEEEKRLKQYFESDRVKPEHQMYKTLFAAFSQEREWTSPPARLPRESKRKPFNLKLWIPLSGAVAACGLLLFFTTPFSRFQKPDYVVIVNGRHITNAREARCYADRMFFEAEKEMKESFRSVIRARQITQNMDADKIFEGVHKSITDRQTQEK